MMETTIRGKIFLNEQNGCVEGTGFRRNCMFNFGNFYNEHRQAFGAVSVFNQEHLAGGMRISMFTDGNYQVILLPVTGSLCYQDQDGKQDVHVGQVLIRSHKLGSLFGVANPDPDHAISFLQLWIRSDKLNGLNGVYNFEDISPPNVLIPVIPETIDRQVLPFGIRIGTFMGRGETASKLKHQKSSFFCFVLAGAFEVQGRLLHALDGLGLWEIDEVDIEALSNNAVMLVFEDYTRITD